MVPTRVKLSCEYSHLKQTERPLMSSRPEQFSARRIDPLAVWPRAPRAADNCDAVAVRSASFGLEAVELALEMVSDSVFLLGGDSLELLAVNRAGCTLLDRSEPEALGLRLLECFDLATGKEIQRAINNASPERSTIVVNHLMADGRSVPLELTIRRVEEQRDSPVLVIARDHSDRQRADQLAKTTMFTDPLTGLADRRAFDQQLLTAIEDSKRRAASYAVLFVDLNDFHLVNEELGHPVGDDVLKEVARRLELVIREGDFVARYGGDEFVILVKSCPNLESLHSISARIDASLCKPIELGGVSLVISASVGLARNLRSARGTREVIELADESMYSQKAKYRRKNGSFRLRAR